MKMNPPKKITFYIAVVLAVLGLLGKLATVPVLSPLAFWLVLVAFIVLAVSLFVKGM
jgi:heme/copper-type cytochrome/quinol oxidase subunit 1